MFQSNCRVNTEDKIVFYEKDVLYDDHMYSGNCSIEIDLDYLNSGFGILLINASSSILSNKNSVILFKLNHKSIDIIYKENDLQRVIGSYRASLSVAGTENLKISLQKIDNIYSIYLNNEHITEFKSDYDIEDYFIGLYSNRDNIINNISVASSVPYGWYVNMQHTNGGYIDFIKDGFKISNCHGCAEIEQTEIKLERGVYYLKYDHEDSDIKSYVFLSNDIRVDNEEKNILKNGMFIINKPEDLISIKFKGTKGIIRNIAITTAKDNSYVRTSPDIDNVKIVKDSKISLFTDEISKFTFKAIIDNVPLNDEYFVIENNNKKYSIDDFNIATRVEYRYEFDKSIGDAGILNIYNPNNVLVSFIQLNNNTLEMFYNTNTRITDFIITDNSGKEHYITLETELKETVPGTIKSPIIITGEDNLPFDLSSSYRYYYENGYKKYMFTNIEREYFEPNHSIILSDKPLNKNGSVVVYCIKDYSRFELDRLLELNNKDNDNIDACTDSYDVLYEENLRYINKETGEIKLADISKYKMIIVDYTKEDSYCLNYDYIKNSYNISISTSRDDKLNVIYDGNKYDIKDLQYINEVRYYNTKMKPTVNGYIVIGGGSH